MLLFFRVEAFEQLRAIENGIVAARKVSGASSVTPSLSTGQLQPQTSVRITTSSRLDAGTAYRAAAGGAVLIYRRSPYLDSCNARACVTH